jgi:hypothetical protein
MAGCGECGDEPSGSCATELVSWLVISTRLQGATAHKAVIFIHYLITFLLYLYSVWLRTGRPGNRGSIPDRSERIFSLPSVSRPALRPTQPLLGAKARPGCDADHSPPSSAEVKNQYELYLLSPQAPAWHVVGQLYL